jgi:hypothetical protein
MKPMRPSLPAHVPVIRVLAATSDYGLATIDSVFMVVWRDKTTAHGVADLRSQCEAFAKSKPAGVLLFTVIHDGATAPDPPERRGIAEFLKAGGRWIKASAVLMEGNSFRAAFVRGVVTGLTMLARQAFPHKVCSLQSAVEMFESKARAHELIFDSATFERAVTETRRAIEAKRLGVVQLSAPRVDPQTTRGKSAPQNLSP